MDHLFSPFSADFFFLFCDFNWKKMKIWPGQSSAAEFTLAYFFFSPNAFCPMYLIGWETEEGREQGQQRSGLVLNRSDVLSSAPSCKANTDPFHVLTVPPAFRRPTIKKIFCFLSAFFFFFSSSQKRKGGQCFFFSSLVLDFLLPHTFSPVNTCLDTWSWK